MQLFTKQLLLITHLLKEALQFVEERVVIVELLQTVHNFGKVELVAVVEVTRNVRKVTAMTVIMLIYVKAGVQAVLQLCVESALRLNVRIMAVATVEVMVLVL